MRKEILDSWNFPVAGDISSGRASQLATDKYKELREGWYTAFPDYPIEKPMVSYSTKWQNGKIVGYEVRTEIVYKE